MTDDDARVYIAADAHTYHRRPMGTRLATRIYYVPAGDEQQACYLFERAGGPKRYWRVWTAARLIGGGRYPIPLCCCGMPNAGRS